MYRRALEPERPYDAFVKKQGNHREGNENFRRVMLNYRQAYRNTRDEQVVQDAYAAWTRSVPEGHPPPRLLFYEQDILMEVVAAEAIRKIVFDRIRETRTGRMDGIEPLEQPRPQLPPQVAVFLPGHLGPTAPGQEMVAVVPELPVRGDIAYWEQEMALWDHDFPEPILFEGIEERQMNFFT